MINEMYYRLKTLNRNEAWKLCIWIEDINIGKKCILKWNDAETGFHKRCNVVFIVLIKQIPCPTAMIEVSKER